MDGLTVLDRLVQVVSIAIVVVAGMIALAVIPYVEAYNQLNSSRVTATATPSATSSAISTAAAEAPAEEVPPLPVAGGEGARTLSAPVTSAPTLAPTPPPALPLAPGETPAVGLVLATMSPFTRDYALAEAVYPDGGLRMPALIQHDYKTVVATLSGRDISVWTSGCGAVAVSMVVSCLTGVDDQTPYTLFRWAAEHGLYKGYGLEHEALTKLASLYGVSAKWIKPDADTILASLKAGSPVIAHMGRGTFTANGHYIVLRGIAPDGTIYVNDPATLDNCFQTFPLEQIIKESKSDDPFMICAAPGRKRLA